MSNDTGNIADLAAEARACASVQWHARVPPSWIQAKPSVAAGGTERLAAFKPDEHGRLCTLQRLDVLDTAAEEPFEGIVALVKQVLNVPICAISLVDKDRQWFKAQRGLEVEETARDISFCRHTITSMAPYIVSDATKDSRFADNPLVTGGPKIRSYAGIPLTTPDGYNVGSLCVIDTNPRIFSDDDISILRNFARVVSGELELRQIASIDLLTGALSRRAWFDIAEAEVMRSARHSRALSLLVIDIDNFKAINDTFGHTKGDMVIRQVAQVAQSQLRRSDSFGRFGGEEFVCVLPETELADALALAERIRLAISQNLLDCLEGQRCTVSIGVSSVGPGEADIVPAFERADGALYLAKQSGRDRIQSAEVCVLQTAARRVA